MSNDSIFDTHAAFVEAARSYFGLPDQLLDGSMVRAEEDGMLSVVLNLALTPDEVVGIAQRMKAMREPEVPEEPDLAEMVSDEITRTDWYDEWANMDEQIQKKFGTWANYKAWRQEQEQKVRKVEMPTHVWLTSDEVTDYQRMMALSTDDAGRYAVAVDDLTPEQVEKRSALVGAAESLREGYVARTVEATERLSGIEAAILGGGLKAGDPLPEEVKARMDRLMGADGKPTSNADDFGGLPG